MKASLFVLFILAFVNVESQPVFYFNQMPAVGSELQYNYLISGPTPQFEAGPNQTWDFSDSGLDVIGYVSYH